MREIKFRAWSAGEGCWCGAFSVHKSGMVSNMIDAKIDKDSGLAISDAHWGENDLKVEMFSGIKDSMGKDIYEGDIVYCAGVGNMLIEFPFLDLYFSAIERDVGAILGNIHENPELEDS